MNYKNIDEELFARSCLRIPGGVNSPVRDFRAVGGAPVFVDGGAGAYLRAKNNRRYIDYVCSWGAQIVGHAHPAVLAAVVAAAKKGLGFGAPTEIECKFAETLCAAVPSMEQVRCVNSGSEATMSALRLARGFCGRDKIIKFAGGYHGHADSLLVAAGSGAQTLGAPSSPGVTKKTASDTVVLPYNDSQAAADAFIKYGNKIAAVIVEPIAGNMNLVIPSREFLQTLREQCTQFGALLIFDEVMTGFRVAPGGAQQLFKITPDITCLGKIIGGGLPAAAFGGRREIMQHLSPMGKVYQAGTLSGNPIALAAGLATLEIVGQKGFYESLTKTATALVGELNTAAKKTGLPFCAQSAGGMWGYYFRATPPKNFAEVQACDINLFQKFHRKMLAQNIYLAPSAYESSFIGISHGKAEIKKTVVAAKESFAELAQ